jgi:protein SCO1/2
MNMKTLLLILLALPAFAAEPARPPASAEIAPCCRPTPPGARVIAPSDKSLFLLESKWTSDRGATVPLAVLRGRPQVVAMFFTHCEYACPILVNDMKRLAAALPAELRDEVDFLLVSMDPKRDTPAALAAFRQKEELPLKNWTLLRGSEDDVRELAALLGINYAPDARGQFAHTNLLTVLNAEGEIAFQQPGLRADPREMMRAIEKAVAQAKR